MDVTVMKTGHGIKKIVDTRFWRLCIVQHAPYIV